MNDRILQINTVAGTGSTGRIAEQIGLDLQRRSIESYIAYGRGCYTGASHPLVIGTKRGVIAHGLYTRFFDGHGLASKSATRDFIRQVERLRPDLIQLHNIHGYYLNYPILFDYLKHWGGPVVWTLHDCWAFTGHCAYYSRVSCDKWKNGCGGCPLKISYPQSWIDRSSDNLRRKEQAFAGLSDLTIVTVSNWLKSQVAESILKQYPCRTIHNGVDLHSFTAKTASRQSDEFLVLGVANTWEERKGLADFVTLREKLPSSVSIRLIGLSDQQIKRLPSGIVGMGRTKSIEELVFWYSAADVYVNLSTEETLGMTSLEAQACGTPVIVYDATGCPETVCSGSGYVVEVRNVDAVADRILKIRALGKAFFFDACCRWVASKFAADQTYDAYYHLYMERLTSNQQKHGKIKK